MIVAVELLLMVPVVTLKVAEEAEAATATEAGTVSAEFELDNVTLAPPLGAACVRVSVQVLEELAPTLVGVQDKAEINTAVRVTVALAELPL